MVTMCSSSPANLAKKKSKTFTGCSTCRQRSLKCGEERPECLRCQKRGLQCGGYSVGLAWPGEEGRTGRRQLLEPALSGRPILSESAVANVLCRIDAGDAATPMVVDLFTVFPLKNADCCDCDETGPNNSKGRGLNSAFNGSWLRPTEPGRGSRASQCVPSPFYGKHSLEPTGRIWPGIDPLFIHDKCERLLMHYWSSCLSGLMTPFPREDNAFRDIITPIALTAMGVNSDSSGHVALLHALYTLAAVSLSHSCEGECQRYFAVARRHLVYSIQSLRLSLVSDAFEEQQATLAAISVLTIIPVFAKGFSDWRAHISGGVAWLSTIERRLWIRSRSAAIIYQLFYIVSSLRPAHYRLAKVLEPPSCWFEISSHSKSEDGWQHHDKPVWYHDTIFGITDRAMAIIEKINNWVYADVQPTAVELTEVELAIYRSDPARTTITSPTTLCERLAHAHAMLFYYACHIYFASAVLKTSPQSLQHLTRCSIEEIEKLMTLECGLNVSGIMWPAFITACETEGQELRCRVMQYFEERECLGLANVTDAKRVILELWKRRDEYGASSSVSWHNVMADLDIDIMLS